MKIKELFPMKVYPFTLRRLRKLSDEATVSFVFDPLFSEPSLKGKNLLLLEQIFFFYLI